MGNLGKVDLRGIHERTAIEILVDGGPLCVANAWDWTENRIRRDLFRIYHKKLGFSLGPFYVSIPLAEAGMKKAIKLGKHLWEEDAHWFSEQKWLHKWVDEQLGKPEDLVGGHWAPDPEEEKQP
jgi:hypothetical protein